MNTKLWLLWAALLLHQLGFAQIRQSAPPMSNQTMPGATAREEIPFKLYANFLIVVQGSLGELRRLNFLIDTGVNPTAIDTRIARKLHLTGRTRKVALFNQYTDVREAVLPSLQLGPIQAESVPAVIQDLSPFEEASGIKIDAVIGFGVLGLSSFSIDYRSKKIVFGSVESSTFAIPFDTGPPVLTIQLQIQNEPVRLLVDTGAASHVLFECQLHGRVHELPFSATKRFVNGTGKAVELTQIWLPGLRLGATYFGMQEALSSGDHANCDRSFDGVVSISRLGLQWVAFDFEHRTFSWKR